MNPILQNPQLRATFESDALSLLKQLEERLAPAQGNPHDTAHALQLAKLTHTIRGASAMVMAPALTAIFDDFERLCEIALSFAGTAPERTKAIYDFLGAQLAETTAALCDTLDDREDSARQHQENIRSAAHATWGEYFYSQAIEVDPAPAKTVSPGPDDSNESAAPLGGQSVDALASDFLSALSKGPVPAASRPAPASRPPLSKPVAKIKKLTHVETAPAPALPVILEKEEVETDLLSFFLEETSDALEKLEQALLAWEKEPAATAPPQTIFRLVHTIKGAANSIGLVRIGKLLHGLEDMLEDMIDGRPTPPATELAALTFKVVDSVKHLIAEAQTRKTSPALSEQVLALMTTINDARSRSNQAAPRPDRPVPVRPAAAPAAARPAAPVAPAGDSVTPQIAPPVAAPARKPVPEEESIPVTAESSEPLNLQTIRVNSESLDQLMKLIGELVINRTRLDKKIADISHLKEELNRCKGRLLQSISEFQDRFEYSRRHASDRHPGLSDTTGPLLRGIRPKQPSDASTLDFSDLELDRYDDFNILSRSLVEIGTDTGEIIGQLDRFFGTFSEETNQFSKITAALQDEITRVRMVPLTPLFRRLQRATRDAAKKENKEIDFEAIGGDVRLDKILVDQVYAPLLHIVRNAVSHGIEAGEQRAQAGKPAAGSITLRGYHQADKVVIEVSDDGRGLDLDAIRAEGIRRGLVAADASLAPHELTSLIFHPGFSTAQATTEISGRGVGLDVAQQEISKLNGSVEVVSRPGEGCTFIIRLPLTLSINQAMIINVGGETLALPINFVERILECPASAVERSGGAEMVRVDDQLVPLMRLQPEFGLGLPDASHAGVSIVVRLADQKCALYVDRILRKQDIVVKPLGTLLGRHPLFSGATLSGEGDVVLIVDVPSAVQGFRQQSRHTATTTQSTPAAIQSARVSLSTLPILVVDDSLSIRKVIEKHLRSLGYEVETAADGLDAIEKLRAGRHSMILTDIEMPRINGFELISEVRRQSALASLPIAIITSRDADKHRQRARELGANEYLIKPVTRDQLGECVLRLLGQLQPVTTAA